MQLLHHFIYVGDWSNGMIGVSKTFGGSSILSSPAQVKPVNFEKSRFTGFFVIMLIIKSSVILICVQKTGYISSALRSFLL